MLQTLADIWTWSEPGLHLLVTSRDEADIHDDLAPDRILPMKNDYGDKDIAAYISQHLRTHRKLRKWTEHFDKIEAALVGRAQGV